MMITHSTFTVNVNFLPYMQAVHKHPFIITLIDSFQTENVLCLVMEFAPGRASRIFLATS
jgi:serine/threonine protein kinase